ncbi:hypothetical protein BaRGS_00006282, partial [Batillaria attramentaria]
RQTSQPMNRMGTRTMSPEHLPGAWTCASCTYVNYPGRTVCEMCGLVNSPRTQAEPFGFMSNENVYPSGEHQLLMSRGNDQRQPGGVTTGGTGDLVTDSGVPPAGMQAAQNWIWWQQQHQSIVRKLNSLFLQSEIFEPKWTPFSPICRVMMVCICKEVDQQRGLPHQHRNTASEQLGSSIFLHRDILVQNRPINFSLLIKL